MIRLTALLFCLSACLISAGQNLVRNPGFEFQARCPDGPGQISYSNFWSSANLGTPDYYNDCSPGLDYGTEFNRKGGQIPHEGHAYAGLQFYNLNRNEFFEYIQTPLDSALTPGALYCVKAFVSRGKVDYAFMNLGAVLSVTELRSDNAHKLKISSLPLGNGQYLTDQNGWTCIRGIYKARGNERLLTIGDFSEGDEFWDTRTRSKNDSLFKSSYYFIDDVSVEMIRDSSECRCQSGTR